jgi:signal recognition particle subunit SRP54
MGQMREQIDNIDDRDLDRIQAIIRSMTPGERTNPKMINGSRRLRIANGSGTQVSDVNGLVTRFFEAQKMMRKMKNGVMPGMPGMPGMGGGGNRKKAKAQTKKAKKGKQRSGNPMKARQQEAERAVEKQRRQEEGGQQMPQLPPGLGGGGQPQLPPGLGGPNMPDLSNFKFPKK